MTPTRKLAIMILLGVAVLTLSIIVFILNRDSSTDILAAIGILGGLAIVVVSLPTSNNHKNGGSS
jgi:vacuolar-type H+-ATPase subunit I/STV1